MPDFGFVTLEVTGLQSKRRRFATWGQQIQTLKPAWELIAGDLAIDVMQQFEAEGGVFRKKYWQQLKPSTIKDRMRKGYPGAHPILVRRGDLYQSMYSKSSPDHIEEITDTSLVFGTSISFAKYHQYGTPKMAARPILGISWQRESGIVKRLNEYIQQTVRDSGL